MTGKQRVKAAMSFQEPDRVPLIEIAAGNRLATAVLGRDANIFYSGAAVKNLIEMTMKNDPAVRRQFIRDSAIAQVQFYDRMGIDAVPIMPGAYVLNTEMPMSHSGMNDNPAAKVEVLRENEWKISDELGFWSVVRYDAASDTSVVTDHVIAHEGIDALRRLLDHWKKKDFSTLPPVWEDAVGALTVIKDLPETGNAFIMGYADICPPVISGWLNQFLEWIITEPRLMHEYMELQTEGWCAVLRRELEIGVDGVFGSMDWCYKNGCLISPRHFREFFAPGLKKIIDLVHAHGRKYIKHCDGNVTEILDIMIDYCGIDAYHPMEADAGMDVACLKKKYGKRITLCGNLDCGEMTRWTPGKIEEEVKRIIGIASPGGGHLMSTSNALHNGIPLENALAYVHAAHKYGKYPIGC